VKLKQLRYFVSLSQTHNIELSARAFGVSPQAIRTQIGNLEREVGADLFFRESSALLPSHAGAALLAHANRVLVHAANLEELAITVRTNSVTSLRIGITGSTMYSGLVDVLVEFGRREPHVEVTVTQQPIRGLLELLRTYEIDLAFLRTVVRHPDFNTTALGDEALWAALPEGHRLDCDGPVDLRELSPEAFVGFVGPFNRIVRDYLSEGCLVGGFVPAIETRTDDVQSLLGLVASGMGVSLVTEGVARAVEMAGVRYRPISPPTPRTEHCVLSHKEESGRSPARRFRELASSMKVDGETDTSSSAVGRRGTA